MDYYFGNPNHHSPQFPAANPSSSSDHFISDYNLVLGDSIDGVGHQEYSCWTQSTDSSEKATNSDVNGFGAASTDAASSENNDNNNM